MQAPGTQPFRRFRLRATISACPVGSSSTSRRLLPTPRITPSASITSAPTGTSPTRAAASASPAPTACSVRRFRSRPERDAVAPSVPACLAASSAGRHHRVAEAHMKCQIVRLLEHPGRPHLRDHRRRRADGCYLVFIWSRGRRFPALLIDAALALGLFAWLLSFTPAGRAYAVYSGVYVAMAIVWGWLVEHIQPDRSDVIGAAVALSGWASSPSDLAEAAYIEKRVRDRCAEVWHRGSKAAARELPTRRRRRGNPAALRRGRGARTRSRGRGNLLKSGSTPRT